MLCPGRAGQENGCLPVVPGTSSTLQCCSSRRGSEAVGVGRVQQQEQQKNEWDAAAGGGDRGKGDGGIQVITYY